MSDDKTKPPWKLDNSWVRCPAVTYGGKAYFWFRKTAHAKQWIVWNRQLECWTCLIEWLT